MDRLALFLTLISGSLITGALVVTAISLGHHAWWSVIGAAGIGYSMAWPSAHLLSKHINQRDPDRTSRNPDRVLPRASARDV